MQDGKGALRKPQVTSCPVTPTVSQPCVLRGWPREVETELDKAQAPGLELAEGGGQKRSGRRRRLGLAAERLAHSPPR